MAAQVTNSGAVVPVVVVNQTGTTPPVTGTVTANQGTAGATPWPVSAAQSGAWTVTANAGTNLNTSALALDATLLAGLAKTIVRGGQKGATTTNADITHTPVGANHEGLDVVIMGATGEQLGLAASPVRVDPTGTTPQPTSQSGAWTVTANAGTNLNTSLLALDTTLTAGLAKTIVRGGQKGATTTNADITHTPTGADHEALDVVIMGAAGQHLGLAASPVRVDPTGTTTQPVSVASLPLPAGAATNAGAPSIATAQVSVAASATSLAAARAGRFAITVTNHGVADVFLGNAGVTPTTGTILIGIKGSSVTIPFTGELFAVVLADTQIVSVLETF